MRAYLSPHGRRHRRPRSDPRGLIFFRTATWNIDMTLSNLTSIVDRVAVGLVYAAVVLAMPFAAYSFVAQSL